MFKIIEYPNWEWNNTRDVIKYYAYYFEEKFDKKMPSHLWGRYGKQVKNQLEKGHSLDDFKKLLWGVFNFENKCKSLNYAFYFWDNVEEYYKIYLNKKEQEEVNPNKQINYKETETKDKEGGILDEFM